MCILILDANNGELLFSIYNRGYNIELAKTIHSFFKSNRSQNIDNFQIGYTLKDNFLFSVIYSKNETWS